MNKDLKYKDKEGNILYGFSHLDITRLAFWVKVLAVAFVILVLFIIMLFLWLKFSGIGHNIIFELSGR